MLAACQAALHSCDCRSSWRGVESNSYNLYGVVLKFLDESWIAEVRDEDQAWIVQKVSGLQKAVLGCCH